MKYLLLALIAAILSGCAFTYPGKHGNITVEFSPTPEMLDHIGVRVHPVNRDKQ